MPKNDFSEIDLNKARRIFLFLAHKLAGDSGLQIAAAIVSNGYLTDDQLSEITGMSITSVRNAREILRNAGLLHEIRERDDSGWIISYWGTDPLSVYRVFRDRLKQVIRHFRSYIEYALVSSFYVCQECGARFSSDEAESSGYQCPICGGGLVREDFPLEFTKLVDDLIEKYRKFSIP